MASISGPSRGALDHTYYDILKICPVATKQQVKDAYKRLAILKYPDKNLGDPAGACATFQQLQMAYDTLSEPTLRAKYDATVLRCTTTRAVTPRNRRPSPTAPARPSTPAQRSSPPARPTAPKYRFPITPLPARDANRPEEKYFSRKFGLQRKNSEYFSGGWYNREEDIWLDVTF